MICLRCLSNISSNSIHGLHQKCFLAEFELEDLGEFHDLDPKKGSSGSQNPEFKKKDTFFHGQYLKFSAKLGSTNYILKIQQDEFPELPASEYLCNQVARILSIRVPPFHLINFNNKMTFVTRNFMQDHVGSLQHIYKFLSAGAEHHSCESLTNCILEQTGKLADVARFAETCLFDALIGNNDRHGRNLGFIETAKGKTLSPMYDNPSYFGIAEEFLLSAHINPSGAIWTKDSREPKLKDYVEELRRLGQERAVELFKGRALNKSSEISALIEKSFLSTKRKKAFLVFVEQRFGDLENV